MKYKFLTAGDPLLDNPFFLQTFELKTLDEMPGSQDIYLVYELKFSAQVQYNQECIAVIVKYPHLQQEHFDNYDIAKSVINKIKRLDNIA